LLVGVQPPESLCGLQHASGGPAKRHPGIPPAFNVAADLPDGPVHVLDDVGAGERTAQLDRQAQAGNGEDLVEPSRILAETPGASCSSRRAWFLISRSALSAPSSFPPGATLYGRWHARGLARRSVMLRALVDLATLVPLKLGKV